MPCDVFSNLLHSVTLPIDVHSDTVVLNATGMHNVLFYQRVLKFTSTD